MFCSKCGEKNVDEAKFCMKCGAPLGAGAPAGPGQGTGNAAPSPQQTESVVSSTGSTTKSVFEKAVSDEAPQPLAFVYEKFNCKDVQSRKKALIIIGAALVGVFFFLLIALSCVASVQRHVELRQEMDKIDREYERDMKELDRMTEKWNREKEELDEEWENAKRKIRETPNPFD